MLFKDRLKEKRTAVGLTQAGLAAATGLGKRTIQSYELGDRKPKNYETIEKIAAALGIAPQELLGTADSLIIGAYETGGAKAARDINSLVSEVTGLFAGGELDDDAIDGAMKAINEAYWIAKEKNKKYTPQKYRKKAPEEAEEGGADG